MAAPVGASEQKTTGDFSSNTEAALNIAKIVALIVAGVWTLYQWNISIFPKETFDQFARRAARRTDLQVNLAKIAFEPLKDSGFEKRFAVYGAYEFANDRDFPIALTAGNISLRFATFRDSTLAGGASGGLISPDWFSEITVPVEVAFNKVVPADGIVVESKGKSNLNFYLPVRLTWDPKEPKLLFEISSGASLEAIDPSTSVRLSGEKRQKLMVYRGTVERSRLTVQSGTGGFSYAPEKSNSR